MFGCIMKIILENIFKCLVAFWKCYFPTSFSHFRNHFLNFQTNFIIENFNNKLKRNKNQNKTFIELKNSVKRRKREEERVIDNWGKGRGRSRKREIRHGWVMGVISLVLGCDETGAIWGWMRWCDLGLWCTLGLDAVVWSGVVVCAISPALLSLLALGSVLFFSRNGLKVSLEMGFGPWGGTIWAGQSLAGLARAWLRWAWIWVLNRVRSVLELSLFRCDFRKLFEGKIKA